MNYDQCDFLNAIVQIKPGSYLRADSTTMVKIYVDCIGVVIGQRIENDNSCTVAIENEILIISKNNIANNLINYFKEV